MVLSKQSKVSLQARNDGNFLPKSSWELFDRYARYPNVHEKTIDEKQDHFDRKFFQIFPC